MAKNNAEWEWRAELTKLLAEVKTNQDNLHEKLDESIDLSQKRFDRLEKTVYGLNGTPGLIEQVRVNKGRWIALITGVTIVVTAVANAAMRMFIG